MKESSLLITTKLGTKWYGHIWGWIICVNKGHKWKLLHHWKFIHEAHMGCPTCGSSQFLEEVSEEWNGQYSSRRISYISATLSTGLTIFATLFIIFIITTLI